MLAQLMQFPKPVIKRNAPLFSLGATCYPLTLTPMMKQRKKIHQRKKETLQSPSYTFCSGFRLANKQNLLKTIHINSMNSAVPLQSKALGIISCWSNAFKNNHGGSCDRMVPKHAEKIRLLTQRLQGAKARHRSIQQVFKMDEATRRLFLLQKKILNEKSSKEGNCLLRRLCPKRVYEIDK